MSSSTTDVVPFVVNKHLDQHILDLFPQVIDQKTVRRLFIYLNQQIDYVDSLLGKDETMSRPIYLDNIFTMMRNYVDHSMTYFPLKEEEDTEEEKEEDVANLQSIVPQTQNEGYSVSFRSGKKTLTIHLNWIYQFFGKDPHKCLTCQKKSSGKLLHTCSTKNYN